jgi:hypothetical protein
MTIATRPATRCLKPVEHGHRCQRRLLLGVCKTHGLRGDPGGYTKRRTHAVIGLQADGVTLAACGRRGMTEQPGPVDCLGCLKAES